MQSLDVKMQYELYPYPHAGPLRILATPHKLSNLHANFEAGAALTHKKLIPHKNKSIALLGCGTDEPLIFAKSHPLAQISAVDLSKKTLMHSKFKTFPRGYNNITYKNQDLIEFCQQNKNKFDYIHSYGVLHHLKNPQAGFLALSECLNDNGFARIMVYSKSARQRINDLRRIFQLLKINFQTPNFEKEIKNFIFSLPKNHPLKLTYQMHPEIHSKSGLVDAFLNAQETSFWLDELKEILKKSNLHIHAWDLSQNIKNLLQDNNENIEYLEATEQWPGHFIFWVAKFQKNNVHNTGYITLNPLIKTLPENFYSTLLKKKFKFNYRHQKLFSMAQNTKYLSTFELIAFKKEMDDFLNTRIFLGVIL